MLTPAEIQELKEAIAILKAEPQSEELNYRIEVLNNLYQKKKKRQRQQQKKKI